MQLYTFGCLKNTNQFCGTLLSSAEHDILKKYVLCYNTIHHDLQNHRDEVFNKNFKTPPQCIYIHTLDLFHSF